MSVNLTINGVAYPFPVQGDSPPWGSQVTAWAQAVTGGMLQKAGGTFTLTNDVDFGASYGLKAMKFSTRAANPSSSGTVRLENNGPGIGWRNAANSGNLILTVNASDQLEFNGIPIGGAAAYTADRAIQSDGSGNLEASAVTATELGYVSGVTSSIQTQLDGKQAAGTYVTSVGGTAPVVSSGGTTPSISMHVADATHDGYLSQTDWSTFNAKQPAGSYLTAVTADAPLSGSGTSGSHLVIQNADASHTGALTSTDWNTFNDKVSAATGNYTLARSSGLITVGNTNTETDLLSFTLTGGLLSTNRTLRFRAFGEWSQDGTNTLAFRLRYGGTNVAGVTVPVTTTTTNKGIEVTAELRANNAAGSQIGFVTSISSEGTGVAPDIRQDYGTASEASGGDLTVRLTAQWTSADTSDTLSMSSEAVLI